MLIVAWLLIAKSGNRNIFQSTNEWIRKTQHIYSVVYYKTMKNDKNLWYSTTWMEVIMQNEIVQSQGDKFCMTELISMI